MNTLLKLLAASLLVVFSPFTANGAELFVTNVNDSGPGSLRQALADGNASQGGDVITFVFANNDAKTIELLSELPPIATDLTILNDRSDDVEVTVQRSKNTGTPQFRILSVTAGKTVLIAGITISNGSIAGVGAGVYNDRARLTLRNCTIRDNIGSAGGGIMNVGGVGFDGTMSLIKCTVIGNRARASGVPGGGGIYNDGRAGAATVVLINSTLTLNSAGDGGGGIGGGLYNDGPVATASFTNCSVIGNTANNAGQLKNAGGEIHTRNTIFARGLHGYANIVNEGKFTSHGHNLSDELGIVFNGPSDKRNVDPLLSVGPARNGGRTDTYSLDARSPAIDAGDDSILADPTRLETDQRDNPRKGGAHVDIGAFEFDPVQTALSKVVTTISNDDDDGVCGVADCTLREALNATNANADLNTITFAPEAAGELRSRAPFHITQPVTISGPGSQRLVIRGSSRVTPFHVAVFGVSISDLTISGAERPQHAGGAIYNRGGLTLTRCVLSHNTASEGGAIYNMGGATLTLIDCALSDNTASSGQNLYNSGGAVRNSGTLTATNCTFSNNRGTSGAAVAGQATLTNCTFSGNVSTNNTGAAIFVGSSVRLSNCTFADHTGSAIYMSGGKLELGNTIFRRGTNGGNIRHFGGIFVSLGHNLSDDDSSSGGTRLLNAAGDRPNTDPRLAPLENNGGRTLTHALLPGSPAINGASEASAPPRDQRGYARAGAPDIGAFEFGGTLAVTLANLSTRLRSETGDDVLIGGFIVTGTRQKKVIVRAIGPSLPVEGRLQNPVLELFNSSGESIATNDDWNDAPNRQAIVDTSIAPTHALEAAILTSLEPGAYTAAVRGVHDQTGIALAEIYDLDRTVDSRLANISTRGIVGTGQDVMIGGLIVVGEEPQRIIIRALGPSLPLDRKLADPALELYDGNGALLAANDNWKSEQRADIEATNVPPPSDLESAIVRTLAPGAYTAIVRGMADTTGIGLVEVYALD